MKAGRERVEKGCCSMWGGLFGVSFIGERLVCI